MITSCFSFWSSFYLLENLVVLSFRFSLVIDHLTFISFILNISQGWGLILRIIYWFFLDSFIRLTLGLYFILGSSHLTILSLRFIYVRLLLIFGWKLRRQFTLAFLFTIVFQILHSFLKLSTYAFVSRSHTTICSHFLLII